MLNSDGPVKLILIGLLIGIAAGAFAQPPPSQCLPLERRVTDARKEVDRLDIPNTTGHPIVGLKDAKNKLAAAEKALAQCIAAARPSPIAVVEGKLYRESGPEIYLISAGKKIWVPTADALFAMGFNWSSVTVVPNGTLESYPRFNIPSSSVTPGSLIFPPDRTRHFPLTVVPGAVKVAWQGKEVQLVELYGWLRLVANKCELADAGGDFHYALELDTEWALANGIDLNRILRVGNVVTDGLMLPGFHPRHAVSLPLIEVELNSWEWGGVTAGRTKPADWTFIGNCCEDSSWPFDQKHPEAGQDQTLSPLESDIAKRGPYVRIAGSLVTDSPHDVSTRPNTFFSHWFAITDSDGAEWEGSVPDWHPGMDSNSPDHYARWTEIHPPDLIQVQSPKEPRVTVRAVALAARVGTLPFGLSNSCEEVEFDIFPEVPRPPGSQIKYEELRGPETFWPWGEDANNGSWMTGYDDHVHIRARVCGGPVFGSPGRFKAIYRVWWAEQVQSLTFASAVTPQPKKDTLQTYTFTVTNVATAAPVPEATVTLHNFDNRGNKLTKTATTNANGKVVFNVVLKSKTVVVTGQGAGNPPHDSQSVSPTLTIQKAGYNTLNVTLLED